MREYVFALEYDPGTNPVADVLEANPDTTIRSLSCHVTNDSLWRVDHAAGPSRALEALEEAYLDPTYFADCLVRDDCGAECETQVLDRSRDELVVYTYWDRTDACTSIPHLGLEYLGDGLLFETYRANRQYRWRIVLGDGPSLHAFYDALRNEVDECTGIETLRLTDVDPTRHGSVEGDGSEPTLPPEQERALRTAVDNGYYETPKKTDLETLSSELDIPRSTLSYRLRRAEATLATSFVDADDSLAAVRSDS